VIEDHCVNLVELIIGKQLVGKGFIIPQGDGILFILRDALLETRALQQGGTGLGLVQVRTGHQHDMVEGADGLA